MTSTPDLAVLNCTQLVTLAGPHRPRIGPEMSNLAIVPNGAMLVREGRIQAVASRAEIERHITAETRIADAGGCIVLPVPGSSPTASMPMVLSLASTQVKMTPADANSPTSSAAIRPRRIRRQAGRRGERGEAGLPRPCLLFYTKSLN